MREINVSRAGDPVHAGDKALTRETPAQRGGLLTGVRTSNGNAIVSFLDHYYNIQIHTCINESSRISGISPVCYILHSPLMGEI